jgi:hypothetical protein
MQSYYLVGLDLGQATDFTALAVLERPKPPPNPIYNLRHLQRFTLGTPYTTIVPAVSQLVQSRPLAGNVSLVVDQTGVGRAVVDMLRQSAGCHVVPITITAGQTINTPEDGSMNVPKKELVTCLQLLFQDRRLQIAKSLPDAKLLVRELSNFRVKITAAANETFGAWREGQHDDLVLAVALAGWFAERRCYGAFEVTEDPKSRSILYDMPDDLFITGPLFPERR